MGFENSKGTYGGVQPFGKPVSDSSEPVDITSGDVGGAHPHGEVVEDKTEPHNFG